MPREFAAPTPAEREAIRAQQAALQVEVDGMDGPMTLAALRHALREGRVTVLPEPVFLPRDAVQDDIPDAGDVRLEGVHPKLANIIREASRRVAAPFTVIEGLRSEARQKELFNRGASKTMNSLHLRQKTGFAHAADLWPLDASGTPLPGGTPEREKILWARLREVVEAMRAIAREQGVMIEFGADWGWDAPHAQLNRKAY